MTATAAAPGLSVSPSSPTPASPRRTQQQRRDATRSALLDATVACLVERGYADLTIADVQARAGVSRGALTHYFASKAELVMAAMDQLYGQLSEHVLLRVDDLPSGPERVGPALELVWRTFDGPLFPAAMELWTAARTDPSLRAALLPHERALGRNLRQLCRRVFGPEATAHPAADAVFDVLLTSMRGEAMTHLLNPDAPRTQRPVEQWKHIVRAVASAPASTPSHAPTDEAEQPEQVTESPAQKEN